MTAAAWIAALRIARREASRHKARSALVIAMIALPVLGVTMADVLARSAHLTPTERLDRNLGAATAQLTVTGCAPMMQDPSGISISSTTDCTAPDPPIDVRSLLPGGSHVVSETTGGVKVRDDDGGVVATMGDELDYADPAVAGVVRQVAGRAPRSTSEVVLSTGMAHQLGLAVGDTLNTVDPDRAFTVVGTVQRSAHRRDGFVMSLPGSLLGAETANDGGDAHFFVQTPGPLTWSDVLALNARGVLAQSRAVILNPPPDNAVPLYKANGQGPFRGGDNTRSIAVIVVAGMALLEVVLLAGPAFAVGARRMRRQLALVAASGGERRHVRNIVLASGVVLGITGGVLGAMSGLGLALIARPLISSRTGDPFGALHLHSSDIAAIAGLGLVTGVLAAVFPAHAAARQDVVAALAGRRGTVRTPKRVPILGVVMFGAGVAIAAYGAATSKRATFILAGAIVAELGLVACSPTLVGWAGRLGARLPAAPRMALRDAARNRSRTAPAVSAIMAAVAGTVAIGVYLSSDDAGQRAIYQPVTRSGQASVQLTGTGDTKYASAISAALQRTLPTRNVIVLQAAGGGCDLAPTTTRTCEQVDVATPPENECPLNSLGHAPTKAELAAAARDWRCTRAAGPGIEFAGNVFIGDVPTLEAVCGLDSATAAKAEAMLNRGGLVTFDRSFVAANATATIERSAVTETQTAATSPDPTRITVPALYLASATSAGQGFVSAATAKALQLAPVAVGVLADTTSMPTASEERAARQAVAQTGSTAPVYIERGFHGTSGLYALSLIAATALITLGASGIVTGLTSADSRPDHATLAAIGANPGTRRLLAMSSSAVTAFLGSLLGIAAGFIPATGVLEAQRGTGLFSGGSSHIAVPWSQLVMVAIFLPGLAALFAGLFTRSRLPMPQRET